MDLVQKLTAEHAALEERVQRLERHLSLSPDEQVALAQLKKLKLRTKERIYELRTS